MNTSAAESIAHPVWVGSQSPSTPASAHQQRREGCLAIGLALLYALWWWLSSYGLCALTAQGDSMQPAEPLLYAGVPLWFILSCLVGPVLFTLLCALMVRWGYQEQSLQPEDYSTKAIAAHATHHEANAAQAVNHAAAERSL